MDKVLNKRGHVDSVLHALEEQHIVAVSQGLLDREDIIPMWFGEGDRATPECVRQAAMEALANGDSFYTEKRGRAVLRSALNDYQKRLYGVDVGIEKISVLASGVNAIQLVLQMVLSGQAVDNENVVIVGPVWPNAAAICELRRAEVRYCLLKSSGARGASETGGGLSLDMEMLSDLVDDKTRAIFVNTPNNPSGWVMSDAEMEALLFLSRSRGCWLIADEVYNRMTYDGKPSASFLTHIEADDSVIIVNSFSKSWAMTGWRVGWLVHPEFLSVEFNKLIEFNYSCVPGFVQAGCVAALGSGGEAFISDFVDYCSSGRDVSLSALGHLRGVEEFCYPAAGFYVYFRLGFAEARRDILGFARRLAEEGGVGLAPGSSFGPGQEGWLRLCFARDSAEVEEAFNRLDIFLSSSSCR